MKHSMILAAAAALLLGMNALSTSESAAEPISGADTLADPWQTTTRTQDTAEAQARFESHDYPGALRLLKALAKNNPDLPPAQVVMAQFYLRADMPVEAEKALQQALVDSPDDPEAYVLLAARTATGPDLAKAEELCQKANSLMSAFNKSAKRKEWLQPRIYSVAAGVAEARKDWPAAQQWLDTWLKLDPKNAGVMQQIAYCLFQSGNVDRAMERLRQAAKADPKMLSPETVLAQYYQQAGDRENATKWMAAAVSAAPQDLRTRLAAGHLALATGQLDEAQKQARAAVQIDPASLEAKFFRGLIALFQEEYEAAELLFEAGLKQSPRSFGFSNNLALSLVEQKGEAKRNRAVELAEANVRQFPKSAEAESTYGVVLYKLGRLDDAEAALGKASSIAESDLDTAYFTARVMVDRGRKAEAKKLLETALKNPAPCRFRQSAEELLRQLKQ
jgi:tetratricopeptide (TPR) repeat protein